MLNNKSTHQFPAVVDDVQSAPYSNIQNQLSSAQESGITALTIETIIFQKMLDKHSVPKDHALRNFNAPSLSEAPAFIAHLNSLGFHNELRSRAN